MRNETGFTLLELIIVIAIAAIMGGIATYAISSRIPGQHLNGAAMALQSELNRAKTEALKSGKQYKVTVSGSNYTFSVGDKASGSGTWTEIATESLPYPDIEFKNTSGDFIFDPRGTADTDPSGSSIILTNNEGNERTISVTLAGRIRSS